MSEWKETLFGQIADIVMGQSPTGDTCNNEGIGTPLLNGPTEFGYRFPNAIQFTSDPKKISAVNDILFCVRGSTTGRMNFADKEYAIGRGLAALRHKKGDHLQPFLKALVDFNLPTLLLHATGSTFPNVSSEQLRNLMVKVPPLPTQTRIAAILSSLDDKIELNRQTNKTLEAIAQTLFKEMCVPKGDELPEGWERKPLDKIADFLNGLALQKYPAKDGDDSLPVIKIRELKNGITNSTDRASRSLPGKYVVKDGDLLFSWSATLEVAFWSYGEGALNQHLFKVTSSEYPLWFCYLWIDYHMDEFRKIASDKTTTMGHIQRRHLTESWCFIPSNFKQIDKVIAPIINLININNIEIQRLITIRENLLPKLMKGEIKV